MITSYEVGAVFAIEDRATPALNAMAEGLERLATLAEQVKKSLADLGAASFAGLTGKVAGLGTAFADAAKAAADLNTQMGGMGGASSSAAAGVNAAADAAARAAAAYNDAASAVTRFHQAMSGEAMPPERGGLALGPRANTYQTVEGMIFGGALGYGASGGGGGGFIGGPPGGGYANAGGPFRALPNPNGPGWSWGQFAPVPPGGGGGGGGNNPNGGGWHMGLFEMAEGFGVWESLKLGAQEELNLTNTALDLGFDPAKNPDQFQRVLAGLRGIAHQAAQGTKYSEGVTAAAMPYGSRVLATMMQSYGTDDALKMFGQVFPTALRSAETAEMMHLGKIDETLPAYIEYAHMTGTYDAAGLASRLNVLRNIAMSTNNTAAAEQSILKYSVPIGKAAGMDADQTAMLTGFLQQMGFNSSTAGTGLSQLLLSVLDTGGGLGGQLAGLSSSAEFRNALSLKPGESAHGLLGNKHMEALAAMGIIGADGKSTVLDDKGGLDAFKLMDRIVSFGETHTREQTLSEFHAAFGTRGERIAGVLESPESIARARTYLTNIRNAPGGDEVQHILSGTAWQMWEQGIARTSDVLNNLGTAVLPAFRAAMEGAIGILSGIGNLTHDNSTTAGGLWTGLASAALAGMAGLFKATGGRFAAMPGATTAVSGARGLAAGGLMGAAGAVLGGLAVSGSDWLLDHILGPKPDAEVPGAGDIWNWIFNGGENPDNIMRKRLGLPPITHGGLIGSAHGAELNASRPTGAAGFEARSGTMGPTVIFQGGITVTVTPPAKTDSPIDWGNALAKTLTDSIRRGLSNGAATSGVGSSIFVPGGT